MLHALYYVNLHLYIRILKRSNSQKRETLKRKIRIQMGIVGIIAIWSMPIWIWNPDFGFSIVDQLTKKIFVLKTTKKIINLHNCCGPAGTTPTQVYKYITFSLPLWCFHFMFQLDSLSASVPLLCGPSWDLPLYTYITLCCNVEQLLKWQAWNTEVDALWENWASVKKTSSFERSDIETDPRFKKKY